MGHVYIVEYSVLCLVDQPCMALCDPMDCSSIHLAPLSMGILQAGILEWLPCPPPKEFPNPGIEPRSPALQLDSLLSEPLGSPWILKWVAYPFSRGSSWPRNRTGVSHFAGEFLTSWATKETHNEILLSHTKTWNNAICSNTDGPQGHYAK